MNCSNKTRAVSLRGCSTVHLSLIGRPVTGRGYTTARPESREKHEGTDSLTVAVR
jgi:hypothetical protein